MVTLNKTCLVLICQGLSPTFVSTSSCKLEMARRLNVLAGGDRLTVRLRNFNFMDSKWDVRRKKMFTIGLTLFLCYFSFGKILSFKECWLTHSVVLGTTSSHLEYWAEVVTSKKSIFFNQYFRRNHIKSFRNEIWSLFW